MKKNLLVIAAAVFFLLGATNAGATGWHHGFDGDGAGNADTGVNKVSVSIKNLAFNSSSNTQANTSANKNASGNGNSSGNTSANANTNAGGNSNTNASTSRSDSRASASASASADATAGSSGGGGSSSVSVEGDETPASSAAGVYVTTSDDTCMGSSGVGGQDITVGFSIGSTWTDSNCIMLKNARELMAQGHPKAAKARLCMDEDNAMAFELAGEPCPRQLASTQAALARIRAAETADDADVAAAKPAVQLAALGDAGVRAAASAAHDDEAPQSGDLLAMVQSFAHTVAAAFSADSSPDFSANPYPMDGIE